MPKGSESTSRRGCNEVRGEMNVEESETRSEFEALQGQTLPNACCRLEQTTNKNNEFVERKIVAVVRSNSEPALACRKWSSAIRVFSVLYADHDGGSLFHSSTQAPCTPSSTSSTVVATEEHEELSPRMCAPLRPREVLARSSSEPNLQEHQSHSESTIDPNFFKSLAKRIRTEREASSHEEPRWLQP